MATADAIVIGGGVNGASVAFHLAEQGIKTTLIEQGPIASGSTGRSGGMVRMHYTNPEQALLAHRSLPYFADWQDRIGVGEPGFSQAGYLRLFAEKDTRAALANTAMLQELGVNTSVIPRDAIQQLTPWLDLGGVALGVYEPDSGFANPAQTAESFAKAAQQLGADIVTNTVVRELITKQDRITGVLTEDGPISAPLVIVCAGAASVPLFSSLGVTLPIAPHRSSVAIVRRPDALPSGLTGTPMITDSVLGSYFRPFRETELLVGLRHQLSQALPTLEVDQTEIDPTILSQSIDVLSQRVPAMHGTEIHDAWSGLQDHTPDMCPILAADVGAGGLFVAAGFSGFGFKSAPFIGAAMSLWMITGIQPTEIAAFDLDRFSSGKMIKPAHPYASDM